MSGLFFVPFGFAFERKKGLFRVLPDETLHLAVCVCVCIAVPCPFDLAVPCPFDLAVHVHGGGHGRDEGRRESNCG